MTRTKMLKKGENNFEKKINEFERSNNTMMNWITFLCIIQLKSLFALLVILFKS